MNNRMFGIIFLISGFLLVLIIVLINQKNILIYTLKIFGFSLLTLAFLILFITINKEVQNSET